MFLLFSHIFTFLLFLLLLLVADCLQTETDFCDLSCSGLPASDLSHQIGLRYSYQYRTIITTSLHGSGSGRNGLALDCVVDIDVVSKCHLMLQIRNPQIKRLSPQKEHSVQNLKTLRESLERARLKFSLRGGRVTTLCFQEGEQVWALNIQRAFLSMLQTSPATAYKLTSQNETDVYGTCRSWYEKRGPVILKTRDLKQCQQSRMKNLWPHSVPVSEETALQAELHCVQRPGPAVMEEVNCTESVSMAMLSRNTGLVKTRTVSSLLLLRVQPGITQASGHGVQTDLQFEEEGTSRSRKRASTPQQAAHTIRMLCGLSDQQTISREFLHLVFLLRDLTISDLNTLWEEASYKCRNDWQPLLDALSACGSENCVLLLTELMKSRELEDDHTLSLLSSLPVIPHPSPQIIASINALLEIPEFRPKALLVGSSLIHQLCRTSYSTCTELPPVKSFLQTLQDALQGGCEKAKPTQVKELLYILKSVGNTGAPSFVPLLNHCALSESAEQELRLAAVQAFRRIPCSENRSVLLQLYGSSQEDPEVRIAAYQQLLRCPHPEVLTAVRDTLRNETSSQVGSYVWSHLTSVFRSEDPLKQSLIELLPDDIISQDFEGEFMKYSSYSDHTVVSDLGITNVETFLVFSPKSFLPRLASANLTVYFNGRASNLLEVDLRVENAEPLFRNIFGHEMPGSTAHSQKHAEPKETVRRKTADDGSDKETCLSDTESYLSKASALFFKRRKMQTTGPKCWLSVKVFGNEVSVFSCEDIYTEINQLSLSMAELAVKLLKGHEVQLNHRAALLTEELVLPSLSGLPLKLGINMTSLLSLRLKGGAHYRDTSHFSLNGHIKPSAYVGLVSRMGVDSVLGQAAVEWDAALRSSMSLDGSVQLQDGQDLRVMLNTPEDIMDIISFSSQVFQLSGDYREEIKGPKSRIQKTTCTPKTLSKMLGWQLCSNASYPFAAAVFSLPPPGPVHFSLRLLKLDRGLSYYLLEAAYSLLTQRGSWVPTEASLHLLLATPRSTVPRDMSLDLALSPHRLLLRLTHPQKTIIIQGQLEQEKNIKSAKVEILIDGAHVYISGLIDKQIIASEHRTRYHVEAKMSPNGTPMILSANVTRGVGRKTSFSASVKNVFRETASVSVALERRRDSISKQYSVEGEILMPGVVGGRMLGLLEQKASLWSSALRLKYGLGGEARHLHQECFTSQRLKSERDLNHTYIMRADHEFYCSSTTDINHKVQVRHEESLNHVKSSLDLSYGKHWDEINNKHKLVLSQTFKNQSTHNHTSYTLEFSLQAPEKNLNYRTQLLHSHLKHIGSESSTHLKIHYNDLTPLVAGLQWKGPPQNALQKKWEGTFNMDTPWLYIYTAHKLSRQQPHTLQLTSELSCSKWLSIRNLVLEGLYRDRGREREARIHLYSPAVTYLQAGGWVLVGKRSVRASCSLKSVWTPPVGGDVSLETSKLSHTLKITSSYGHHNTSVTAALNSVGKKLKKRQAVLKMAWCELPGRPTELVMEGAVEELRKDKKMFQKMAKLHLRQPFQAFPLSFVLLETFTVDILKGLYILESKASLHGNKEVLHTLTIGYRPPNPFICSALVHPFGSSILPSDSELCVALHTNQTQKNVHGRLRVGSKERLAFFGQVKLNPLHSKLKGLQVWANFSHQLQLQLPSSAIMEANVCWVPKNSTDFDYQAKGKLRIERQECKLSLQLNGTSSRIGLFSSLSHPFKSKIPKRLEAKATADIFTSSGGGRSSVHLRADGKDRITMDAQVFHSIQKAERAVGVNINVSQSLLPTTTQLFVDISANMSSDSVSVHGSYKQGQETLLTKIKGSIQNVPDPQVAVSGDLQHNIRSLSFLPSALGFDGELVKMDSLIEGQLKVKKTDSLYRVELRHKHGDIEEEGYEEDKSFWMSHNCLCVWSGVENLCVNVSHRLGSQHRGEIYTQLSHNFRQLKVSGVPSNSSAKVGWVQDNGQMSALAELQSGAEHLKAEFIGSKESEIATHWKFSARLEHQVKALMKSDVPNSVQAKVDYKLESEWLYSVMTFTVEGNRLLDVILNAGSKNSTALLTVSLWQQIKLLQGILPTALQMNCTGDTTSDRLSAQCYGNMAGRPLEVRVFRSYRPQGRLCYGLAFTHTSFSAQAKACSGSNGQKELGANFTHFFVPLLTNLGIPTKTGIRILLRPGPQRSAIVIGLVVGHQKLDLNMGLRSERDGLYGMHGLYEYTNPIAKHKVEMAGRIRIESWCNLWADVSVKGDSVSSHLLISVRCSGVGRLIWRQMTDVKGDLRQKILFNIHGQVNKEALKGSLSLEKQNNSLRCLLSLLLKDHKLEVDWILQHHWPSITHLIPKLVSLQGSAQLHDTSLSGGAKMSFNNRSAQVHLTAAWNPNTSITIILQSNSSAPVILSMSSTQHQNRFQVESNMCTVTIFSSRERKTERRTSWSYFVEQRCPILKTVIPSQSSFNLSMSRSGCSSTATIILKERNTEKGSINVFILCQPFLSFKASVQQSMDVLQKLGFPAHGQVSLNHSPPHSPGTEIGLELGSCHFRSHFREKTQEFTVNATSYCPTLQQTALPVSLDLRGHLSLVPCRLTLSSAVRADQQDLSLNLLQSCSPPHMSASLSHSFTELQRRGLPQELTVEASAPWGPGQSGALLIEAGPCHLKASRVKKDNGRMQWVWAVESDCPLLEAHVNGSVWQDPQGVWAAIVETSLDGKQGFLRLNARAWPELHLETEIRHNSPALRHLPEHSRLRVTTHTGTQPYNVEALIQMDGCVVRAKGAAQHGLQGELEYNNNCSVIEKWGSPDRIHASGSLVISSALAKSQVSMAIDKSELQALVTLKNTKDKNYAAFFLNHSVPFLKKLGLPLNTSVTMHSGSHANGSFSYFLQSRAGNQKLHQEMSVLKISEAVRVQSSCRHTVDYLKKLGVPGNNSIQVELRSGESRALSLQSWFGTKQAGLSLKMKCLHLAKEVKAAVWHTWSWLQDKGVPALTEGLLSLQWHLSQLQSKAQLSVDSHKLLSSGLNVSAANGRLAALLSYVSPASNQTVQQRLDSVMTVQFKGPVRSASVDVCSQEWRLLMMGDVGGWGGTRGFREARVTVKHTVRSQSSPAFHVEAWGRLTESQLRCSMALNPELSSSLALIVQGHHLPHSKDLMFKVVQNIPRVLMYLPSQLNVRSQLNQSQSSISTVFEVLSGRRRLWAFAELAAIESGYRQALELKHSYPQLKPLPRMVAVRTVYETRNWSCQIQHEALWGNQEVTLHGLYSAPPALNMGNHTLKIHISSAPRWTNLDLTFERFPQGRLDSLSLDWTRHGRLEQVRVISLWSQSKEVNETKLELQQPFSSKLSRVSLSSVSQRSVREQHSSQQMHLLWDGSVPLNLSLSLNKQSQDNSSRGQACAVISSHQAMSVPSVKGCLSAAQEGSSYSQNAELRWYNRSVKQGMKYQRGQKGLHILQVNVWLDKVSPAPCPSQTLLAKIQTNLRDRLEHTILLGICPPQPSLSWSGSHRVNFREELFFSQSRLSVTQRPYQCSLTIGLTNFSTPQRTNISLFSESRIGNWSIEVGGSAQTWSSGSGIQLHTILDRRETVWLNGTLTGRCLQTTAGFMNAPGLNEDITVRACVRKDRSLTFDVEGKDSTNEIQSLGSVSVGAANQKLALKARGCMESLTAVEAQIHHWSSHMRNKLLNKIKTLQHLLTEFRRQSRDSELVQELSLIPLHVLRRLEVLLLLGHTDRGPMVQWQKSTARHFVTNDLHRFLSLLQHASLLGQQELKRPLATLAGVHQDVTGQKVEALWREVVSSWTQSLVEVVPVLMNNPQLQPLVQACVTGLSIAVDLLDALKELKRLDADQCNIVQWNNVFFDKGYICLEFECLDTSLCDFIKNRNLEPLLISEIRPIIEQLAVALFHLTNLGMMHADIKLENVMLVNHTEQPYRIKLIDFGLASKVSKAAKGSYIQSRAYRSPEVLLGFPLTSAIDVWSLGCLAAFLYLGCLLYNGNTEYDMLQQIMETQGPIPHAMLCKGVKTSKYFWLDNTSTWRLKTCEQYQIDTGRVPCDQRILKCSSLVDLIFARPVISPDGGDRVAEVTDRIMFVDMIMGILTIGPNVRKTPLEILKHPFICMSHLDAFLTTTYAHSSWNIMESCHSNSLDEHLKFSPEPRLPLRSTTNMASSSGKPSGSRDRPNHRSRERSINHTMCTVEPITSTKNQDIGPHQVWKRVRQSSFQRYRYHHHLLHVQRLHRIHRYRTSPVHRRLKRNAWNH